MYIYIYLCMYIYRPGTMNHFDSVYVTFCYTLDKGCQNLDYFRYAFFCKSLHALQPW